MEISWLGHSAFKLRGKNVTIITDPFDPQMVGLKFPKVEADIVTISHDHQDHNQANLVEGKPFIIQGPGEYEIKGVSIFGVACFHDSSSGTERGKDTAYAINIDGLRVCHLGDLGHKLTSDQLEELNGVEILLLPVGGNYTLGPKEAGEVVLQLEPKIVIPMHYQTPGLNPQIFAKLSPVEEFLKAIGETAAPQPKLVITSQNLPEERQVVILERKNA